MQKRGQLRLSNTVIIEIVLLVAITTAFFYFHKSVEEDTLFERSYASRDMALLLETSQSVPGDIEVAYSQPTFDIGKYNYRLTDNLLRIFEGENYLFSTLYPFFLDDQLYQTFQELELLEHPAAFIISKEKGNLEVKEHGSITPEAAKKIICPAVSSTKTARLSLVVVAEDTTLASIAIDFINNPKIDFSKKSNAADAITEKTSLVLLLDAQAGSSVTVFVPVSDDQQSEKIGCLIAAALGEKFPDAEIAAIQKSSDTLLTKNPEGLAVRIVLGKDLLTDMPTLRSALREGMENYYE